VPSCHETTQTLAYADITTTTYEINSRVWNSESGSIAPRSDDQDAQATTPRPQIEHTSPSSPTANAAPTSYPNQATGNQREHPCSGAAG